MVRTVGDSSLRIEQKGEEMMVIFMTGVGIFLWLCVGAVLAFMAGTTHNFAERHFDPAFMLILGPVGIPVWWLAEKIEKRKG